MTEQVVNYESFGELKTGNGFNSYFAMKKGKGHTANGKPCQDYCLVKNIGMDIQVIAIADGHGGEEYVKSDIGSKMACELLYDFACKFYETTKDSSENDRWIEAFTTSEFKSRFISTWRSEVCENYKSTEEFDEERDKSIVRKYGTTLIFAILTDTKIVIGQLGDGAVLLFDKYDQFQLFKRHNVKTSSSTSSLASSRAEYSFIIDCYERNSFPYILLSTDGIYDKLDQPNAFYTYGKSLVNQIETTGFKKPFNIDEGTDVSEFTRDDCTIVFVKDEKATPLDDSALKELLSPYEDITFFRKVREIEIFKAMYEGKSYILHVVDNPVNIPNEYISSMNEVIEPDYTNQKGTKTLYAYPFVKERCSVKELIEMGEHLEKKYNFNKSDIEVDETEGNCKDIIPYSNEYWMNFFEQLFQLKENLDKAEISLKSYAFESAFLSDDGKLSFYADAFENVKENDYYPIEQLKSYFSILGKIICVGIELPIYKCISHGQNIDMLHYKKLKKSLGRIVCKQDSKQDIYGLWNLSENDWILLEEGKTQPKKKVLNNKVLPLNKNCTILLPYENADNLIDDAVTEDKYIKYQIVLY